MCKEFLSVNQSKPCATFRAPAKLQGFFWGGGCSRDVNSKFLIKATDLQLVLVFQQSPAM